MANLPGKTLTNKQGVRFIITCAPRTGSTMLRLLLNSYPRICCHGEVFFPDKIVGFVGIDEDTDPSLNQRLTRLRQGDPARFLRENIFHNGESQVVGFKIKYSELELPQWKAVFDLILNDQEFRIIHLTRENRLKRYISHVNAIRNQINVVFSTDQIPDTEHLTLTPEQCLEDFRVQEEAERRIRRYFYQHKLFEITYEQTLDNNSGRIEDLQNFLGVEPVPLHTKSLKLLSDNLEELLDNYVELKQALAKSHYSVYFT